MLVGAAVASIAAALSAAPTVILNKFLRPKADEDESVVGVMWDEEKRPANVMMKLRLMRNGHRKTL